MDIFNNLSRSISENKIASSIVSLLLVLYAAMAAPKLPRFMANLFKNSLFKLAFMFLISYTATKDPTVALISSVVLLVTVQTLAAYDDADKAVNMVGKKLPRIPMMPMIPMTPERKQFIDDCANEASICYKKARSEQKKGCMKKAKKLIKKAKLQEAKINNIVVAKELKEEGIAAQKKGNHRLADMKFKNADINEIIVASLVKAEYLKVLARNAKNNGNIKEAVENLKEAFAQEAKADAITKIENNPTTKPDEKSKAIVKLVDKADELNKASIVVATQGQPDKAAELKNQAAKEINKVVAIVKTDTLLTKAADATKAGDEQKATELINKAKQYQSLNNLLIPQESTIIVGNDTGLFADVKDAPLLTPHSKEVLEAQNLCSAPRKLGTECLAKGKKSNMCDMTGIKEIGGYGESEFAAL
jgi:tetratricopeptide (TPR) repeat protein